MSIGFVGAGKVATAFGRYLHACGEAVSGYFDRHPEKVDHAARATSKQSLQERIGSGSLQ
jgi:phosphoglycerate dehydrogenase-like enzyme